MIKAVLIDDELLSLKKLSSLLQGCSEVEIIASFTDPIEALLYCIQQKPDVIFVDIEMPVMNGLEFANRLFKEQSLSQIVFVTAFDHYAVHAFEVDSLDYLLKPVTEERLQNTINRIQKLVDNKIHNVKINQLENIIRQNKVKINKVVIMEEEKLVVLNPHDIYCFMTNGNQVRIVTKDKIFFSKDSLTCWEEKLTRFDFFRCHKSFLVNTQKIAEVHTMFNGTYLIKLADNKCDIPVSRRCAGEFKALLGL